MNPGTREEGEEVMEQLCEHCEGEMDAFGGVHMKGCPALKGDPPPAASTKIPERIRVAPRDSANAPAYEYVLADSPNVLTPEEARLIASYLDERGYPELESLRDRLKAWAEEEGH